MKTLFFRLVISIVALSAFYCRAETASVPQSPSLKNGSNDFNTRLLSHINALKLASNKCGYKTKGIQTFDRVKGLPADANAKNLAKEIPCTKEFRDALAFTIVVAEQAARYYQSGKTSDAEDSLLLSINLAKRKYVTRSEPL